MRNVLITDEIQAQRIQYAMQCNTDERQFLFVLMYNPSSGLAYQIRWRFIHFFLNGFNFVRTDILFATPFYGAV